MNWICTIWFILSVLSLQIVAKQAKQQVNGNKVKLINEAKRSFNTASRQGAVKPRARLVNKETSASVPIDINFQEVSKVQESPELQVTINGTELPSSPCFYITESDYTNLSYCYTSTDDVDAPPPCITNVSELVFREDQFSIDQTFYNCLANVYDSPSIPTVYNGQYNGCTFILTAVTLLNIVEINELQGTASLQLIVDYEWHDNRYNMPMFWANVEQTYSGIDLTAILANESTVMWLPEVSFPDAAELNVQSETLALYQPNFFIYEVLYDITLVQPLFDFRKYPTDTQDIVIRYTVLNYDALELQMFPIGVFCSYLQDGTCSVSHNPIWNWNEDDSTCTTYYDKKIGIIWPAYAMYTVSVTRSSSGVIIRLVMPLTLLILLSALTFWITYENRVDTTITLLLAVSALYIIILQNIPMVGYLTNVDRFVFGMFLLLCIAASMHQVYATLRMKTDRWPLRVVYLRLIEVLGRCGVPPAVLYYFSTTVGFSTSSETYTIIIASAIVSVAIFFREMFGIKSTYQDVMVKLVDKVNAPETTIKDLSPVEAMAINLWVFQKFSFSKLYISKHLAQKGCIENDAANNVFLKNIFSLNNLLGKTRRNTAKNNASDPTAKVVELQEFKQNLTMDLSFNPIIKAANAVPADGEELPPPDEPYPGDSDDEVEESKSNYGRYNNNSV